MASHPVPFTMKLRIPNGHRSLPGYVPPTAIPVHISDRRELALFGTLEHALAASRRTKAPVGVLTALIAGTAAALEAGAA